MTAISFLLWWDSIGPFCLICLGLVAVDNCGDLSMAREIDHELGLPYLVVILSEIFFESN